MRTASLSILLPVLLLGCEPSGDVSSGATPWETPFTFGQLEVDGQSVVTTQAEADSAYQRDTVCRSTLPEGPLAQVSLQVFLPAHPVQDHRVELGVSSFRAALDGGARTTDLVVQVDALGASDLGGTAYSTFEVRGDDQDGALTAAALDELSLVFDDVYLDPRGEEIHRSSRSIVYTIEGC